MNKSPYENAFVAFANIVYDTSQLKRLIDNLNLIERSLFKNKEGTISAKAKDYLTGVVISIFQEIEQAGLEPQGDQKQLQFLKDLVSFLNNLPVVKVTIAFDPATSYVIKLNNQISTMAGKKLVVEIYVNDKVIGGAIFEYHGKILEQTLQNKLESKLSDLVEKMYAVKNPAVLSSP